MSDRGQEVELYANVQFENNVWLEPQGRQSIREEYAMLGLAAIRSVVFSCCGTMALLCLALVTTLGCQRGESPKSKEGPAPKSTAQPGAEEPKNAAKPTTGREVLARMVEVYGKASSYEDMGTVHMLAEADGKKVHDETAPFSMAFVRPNKLHVSAYKAEMVCDGDKAYGYVRFVPGQVFTRPAPEKWTMRNIHPDMLIARAMTQGFAGSMPQIPLLLGENVLDVLLRDLGEPELDEPGEIGGHECYRVKLRSPDGVATFWVDKESYTLRRVVLPTDSLRAAMSQDAPISNLSVVADLTGATLNGPIDGKAFQFEVPKDARLVEFLVPPVMGQLLNKKAPDFKLTDLSGKAVTPESFAGKTAVILFWSVRYDSCRQAIKALEEVYQKHKDNPKTAFYAVCIDPAQFTDADLKKAVSDLQIQAPILRDIEMSAAATLNMGEPPAMVIINDKGVVQHCEAGGNPKLAESLLAKLDKCLAGQDISGEAQKQYDDFVQNLQQFAKSAAAEPKPGEGPAVRDERLPEVKTAPRSEPTTFKLTPLWKCNELKAPGNIVVVAGKSGPERLLVVEDWNSVAEVRLDGKLIAPPHKVNLDPKEAIGSLRTAAGADGRRYYVAFLVSQQRCHVLDDRWNLVAHYPEDALTNPHSGIADARLGDLDGDGKLKMYVSYFGVVGVQGVSLEGKRLWANRSAVSNVACMAIGDPDAKGRRDLFCTSNSGAVVLDAKGDRRGEVKLHNRPLNWIANADLHGNGELSWCVLTAVKVADNIAVGFSLNGEELWTYTLPAGIQPQPIEPVISGRITRDGAGQWLLPGPDGSISILSADGKPLDKFNYGAVLNGLATSEIDGRPVLVVSSSRGLEAWKVE
jgi:peroxiredoxin